MEAVLEKEKCVECGAEVRDGTQFCYACGKPVVHLDATDETDEDVFAEPRALDPAFETSAPVADIGDSRVRDAANARREARNAKTQPKQLSWQEPSDATNIVFVGVSLLIFILAAIVVGLLVLWR